MGNDISRLEQQSTDSPSIKDYIEQIRLIEDANLRRSEATRAQENAPSLVSSLNTNSQSSLGPHGLPAGIDPTAGQASATDGSNLQAKRATGQPPKYPQLQPQGHTAGSVNVLRPSPLEHEIPLTNEQSPSKSSRSEAGKNPVEPAGSFISIDSTGRSLFVEANDRSPIATASKPAISKSSVSSSSATVSKRPASVFADERRSSVPRRLKTARGESGALPTSTNTTDTEINQHHQVVENDGPPQWYKVVPNTFKREKNSSGVDTALSSLKTAITKAKSESSDRVRMDIYGQVRHKLHNIAFLPVTPQLLKAYRMLHGQDGLPQLFDERFSGNINWPWDVQADARELYNKWCRRIFQTDIMRGIEFDVSVPDGQGGKRKGDRIELNYKDKIPAKYHGNGDLVNGQWWPLQLCALRDGAHGVTQGGICGKEGEGVYSVIMSGEHDYPDEDHGEWVLYCGTDSTDGTLTMNTQLMIESSKSGRPVRLLRSWKVGGQYAPQKGLRYDGLYVVTSYENLDGSSSKRQRHRFHLDRCPGQDPIRGGNGQECRPTEQELDVYNKHQRMSGKKK